MSRGALASLLAAAALALGVATTARAGDECNGLDICIALAGPWVVVPAPTGAARTPTYYELRCPRRNMVVAGLDADLADRRIGLEFLGTLGGPVGPGITTANAVVFVATYTGAQRRPTSFRPRIGCVPLSGGGGRETTSVSATNAQQAARPPVRRVRAVRIGTAPLYLLRHGCNRGERIVSSSAALAFRRADAPKPALMQTVRLTTRVAAGAVLARAESSLPRNADAEVQIHAVCARGR